MNILLSMLLLLMLAGLIYSSFVILRKFKERRQRILELITIASKEELFEGANEFLSEHYRYSETDKVNMKKNDARAPLEVIYIIRRILTNYSLLIPASLILGVFFLISAIYGAILIAAANLSPSQIALMLSAGILNIFLILFMFGIGYEMFKEQKSMKDLLARCNEE